MSPTEPLIPGLPAGAKLTDLTPEQFAGLLANAGSNQGAGIGLAKGAKQQGITGATRTRGGPVFFPAANARTPASTYTQYGTPVNTKLYQEGDQNNPGADPETAQRTQAQLVQAGLLHASDVRPGGMWDAKSADAFKVVLAFANVHGMRWQDAMNVFLDNPKPSTTKPPAPIGLTNPLDSQYAIANQASSMIGGGLSAQEQQDFASAQTGAETAAANQKIAAKAGQQPTVTKAPDATTNAREYLLQHNQQDIVNYDMALRTMQFQQALKEL